MYNNFTGYGKNGPLQSCFSGMQKDGKQAAKMSTTQHRITPPTSLAPLYPVDVLSGDDPTSSHEIVDLVKGLFCCRSRTKVHIKVCISVISCTVHESVT